MFDAAFAAFLPPALIVPLMGALSRKRDSNPLACEIRRKCFHVATGLAALSLPWLIDGPLAVLTAFALVVGWLLAVRHSPFLARRFGAVLTSAGRRSDGELWFAVSVAGLLLLDRSGYLYFAIPLLVLTISDSAAAIVGKANPQGLYSAFGQTKSVSGSAAFLCTAFLIVYGGLLFAAVDVAMSPANTALIAFAIASIACLTEAVSPKGLDNLTVPAVTWMSLAISLGASS